MGAEQSRHIEAFKTAHDVAGMSREEKLTYKHKLEEQLDLVADGAGSFGAERPSQAVAASVLGVFGSEHFSDKDICEQLVSTKYQTTLAAHRWPELEALGPCFVTLARASLDAVDASGDVRGAVVDAIRSQEAMPRGMRDNLCGHVDAVLGAMREIAESYLARGLPKPKAEDHEDAEERPVIGSNKVLEGANGIYRPVSYINKGSAGVVYAAVKLSAAAAAEDKASSGSRWSKVQSKLAPGAAAGGANFQVSSDVVLKKINETQKDSAENEYKIASSVAENGGDRYCIPYSDRICEDCGELWLVLKRVKPSSYGIDLTEYIRNGFFQQPGHEGHARSAVLQLLEGLKHVASSGVVMRDVKPDNVLVEFDEAAGDEAELLVRWTDFGLSVNLKGGGALLRRPASGSSEEELAKQLVGWWYDTQKQVMMRPGLVG